MVFHVKQSNPRGRRIYATSDRGVQNGYFRADMAVDVPSFWERSRVNLPSAGIRRAIEEDFTIEDEDLPATSALGDRERQLMPGLEVLQEGRYVPRRRSINEARASIRFGRDQVQDREWNL